MDNTPDPKPITVAEVRAELVEIELRLADMLKRMPQPSVADEYMEFYKFLLDYRLQSMQDMATRTIDSIDQADPNQ